MPRHYTARQDHDISVDNGSFESMSGVRYVGTSVSTENFIHEEVESK
jgi:hypothetical protein